MVIMVDPSGEEHILDLDELFKKKVYEDQDGQRWIFTNGSEHGQKLDDLISRHRLGTASVRAGATSAVHDIEVAVFMRGRSLNQRAFWSLSKFYEVMRMKSYSGIPSKWVAERGASWSKAFVTAFGSDQMCHSSFLHDGTVKKQKLQYHERCLPFTGASTVGCLHLLSRWAFTERFRGGLDDPSGQQQQAANDLFLGMLQPVASEGSSAWTAEVLVVGKWVCTWPRPISIDDRDHVVKLKLENGKIDLSGIFAMANAGVDRVAKQWAQVLGERFGGAHAVDLGVMVQMIVGINKLEPLLLQILWRRAVQLEIVLGRLAQKVSAKSDMVVQFAWTDCEAAMTGSSLGLKLAQYVRCTQELLGHSRMYALACDKGSVNKLPLRNGILHVPSGHAALCCPTVCLIVAFSDPWALGHP